MVVVAAQLLSAATAVYVLLLAGRVATGFGFGLLNSAVNLAAGRTTHPARAISAGIAFQTSLFAAVNIGLPMVGAAYGVDGMFIALAALSAILGLGTLLLPNASGLTQGNTATQAPVAPIGRDGWRVLTAMALFAFGSLAIWPFMERAQAPSASPRQPSGNIKAPPPC
jgi:predicted MFS family arabinose efflux permease